MARLSSKLIRIVNLLVETPMVVFSIIQILIMIMWLVFLNPLMHNVPKWSDIKNLAAFAARFLKCV